MIYSVEGTGVLLYTYIGLFKDDVSTDYDVDCS